MSESLPPELEAGPIRRRCLVILSEKSSGSSALQDFLTSFAGVNHVDFTRHAERETLYWVKAASILGLPQLDMVDSEVPIPADVARRDLKEFLGRNIAGYRSSDDDLELVFEGWYGLCREFGPVFVEKSPHHLCQESALRLLRRAMEGDPATEYLLVGLVRNPLDTLYSQYRRWRSRPEDVEKQWVAAYRNLERLQVELGDQVVVVRYEDLPTLDGMGPVLDFCGIEPGIAVPFHDSSHSRWQSDDSFGFVLGPEASALAARFHYPAEGLAGQRRRWWPVRRELARAAYRSRVAAGGLLRRFAVPGDRPGG